METSELELNPMKLVNLLKNDYVDLLNRSLRKPVFNIRLAFFCLL